VSPNGVTGFDPDISRHFRWLHLKIAAELQLFEAYGKYGGKLDKLAYYSTLAVAMKASEKT